MNNIKSKLKTWGLQQQIRWWKITEQDVLVIAANQFAGHGVARPSLFYNNYVGIRNESIYKRIKVLIKSVCKLPFTFYLYSLIQFFNFRTKIPLRPRKTLKLLITSSYNGQQLVFLENRIIFKSSICPLVVMATNLKGINHFPGSKITLERRYFITELNQ